ncbi:unnamed protein product [Ixodes persulcatus]
MFSADINRCCVFGVCVLCVVYFLDLLTLYVATFVVIFVAVTNYYLHQREENSRHRLRILGLIKHDKRERKSKTAHNSSRRLVTEGSATRRSTNTSRTLDSSYEYVRIVPGNKFETTSESRSEVKDDDCSFASPMSPVKNAYFDRSCQSSFTSDHARKSQLDWAPPTTRRYPIQQERYSVGSYPTICLTKSPLPVARPFTSPEVIAPVKVKILPLASSPRLTSSFSQQRTTCGDIDKQDPCSTESVIQALKERRKRAAAAAYRDSLEAAELGMPAHSSKRSRRDSVCAMGPPMPSFMPVATSVGGLGPPFHAPSSPKRAVEGAFKRARLPSTAGASLSKRQRNNAISMSYCSSKAVLETSQLQKRKAAAAARDTPPRSKLARNEDRCVSRCSAEGVNSRRQNSVFRRSSDADSTAEKAEDSAGEGVCSVPADRSTPDPSKSDGRTSGPRRDALPSDQSVRKKRLVFPEHVATLEEHESDRARDRQRLNKMLGSVRDVYQSSQGQSAAISSQENAGISTGATTSFSLPAFSIASTTTSTTACQESTKAVSVISSPLMSVSCAPSTKQLGETPAEKTSPEGNAAAAATSSTINPELPKVPSTTEAPKTNPLLGAPLSIITTSVTAPMLKLPASVPILATGSATNPLLRGLSAPTSSSSSHASAKLELPAPITSFAPTTSFDGSSNPLLSKSSLHGRLEATATATTSVAASLTTFGAPTFKVNGPSTTESGTSLGSFPSTSLAPIAAGSSPFKLGTPSVPAATTVAATTAAASVSLPSFRPSVQTHGLPTLPAATATTLQQSGGGGFAFGGSLATSTAPVALSFGPAATSSGSTAPFKFGAPPTQSVPGSTGQPPVPALSTATASSGSSLFAFGTPPTTTKAEPIAAPFAFGKSPMSSPANTRPSFGVPTTASFVLGSSLTSFQPPPTTPLFPSASSVSRPSDGTAPTASQSGIQFGARAANQPSSGAITTASQVGFQFGTQSTSASQPSVGTAATVSQVGFQFGTRATSASQPSSGTTATVSQSGFHFGAQATSASQPSSGATTTASQGGFQFGTHATRANQPLGGTTGLTPSQGGFQFGTHASTASQPLSGATTAASQGGFQFGAQQPGFGFAATNGLANGVSSSGAGSQSTGVFKFGGSVAPPVGAPPSFNFVASQCGPSLASNPAFNFGAQVANSSLFSIGTAASHSERTLARPRSKRITKK